MLSALAVLLMTTTPDAARTVDVHYIPVHSVAECRAVARALDMDDGLGQRAFCTATDLLARKYLTVGTAPRRRVSL